MGASFGVWLLRLGGRLVRPAALWMALFPPPFQGWFLLGLFTQGSAGFAFGFTGSTLGCFPAPLRGLVVDLLRR